MTILIFSCVNLLVSVFLIPIFSLLFSKINCEAGSKMDPNSLFSGTRITVPGGGDLRGPDNVVLPADDL
jgi:hypothetical protein